MSYLEHKKHFGVAYRTGTDAWTHPPTELEGLKFTERLLPGSKVLDIGSGRGFFAKHLAEMGFEVTGIDFEKDIIEKANENVKDWGLENKLKFIEADALTLPFADQSFDAACDFGLFETLYKEDWPVYANEIAHVLKPGAFYLNVSLSRETQHFFEFLPKKDMEGEFEKYGIHYHFFEKSEMENIFKDKFEIVSQETTPSHRKVVLLETLFQKHK